MLESHCWVLIVSRQQQLSDLFFGLGLKCRQEHEEISGADLIEIELCCCNRVTSPCTVT